MDYLAGNVQLVIAIFEIKKVPLRDLFICLDYVTALIGL